MPGIHAAVAPWSPSRLIAFDDDDGFGDFKFVPATFAAQPVPPQQHDDEWGDFVVNPAVPGIPASPPLPPFDPFPPAYAGIPSNGDKLWEKPRGALPLSIFGEEAEAEAADNPSPDVEPPALSVSFPSPGQAAKASKRSLAGGELRDLISSLYGQNTTQSKDGEKDGSSSGETKGDDFMELSWEFKDALSSSPNSVLIEDGIQKESGLASIAIVDFTKDEVIQIRSGNPKEANGLIGDGSNGQDDGNGITSVVAYNSTSSSYKDLDAQDKTRNVPNGYGWFYKLDNRKKICEDERWAFNDNSFEGKIETTSGQQSSERQKIQAAEGEMLKTTKETKPRYDARDNMWLSKEALCNPSDRKSAAYHISLIISDVWSNTLDDWPGKEADGRSFNDRNSSEPIFPENAVKDIYIPALDLFIEAGQGCSIDPAKDVIMKGQNSDTINSSSSDLYKDRDLDEDDWEFLVAPAVVDSKQNSASEVDNNCSNKLACSTVVDFYQRLKDGSISLLNCHFNDLKKAYEVASSSGQQVKAMEINNEIEEAYKTLQEVKGTENGTTGKHLPVDVYVNQLLEAIEEPNFQALVQELSERIISAGKKSSEAIKFLEHTTSALHILALGSKEDHHAYISTWSDLAAICAEELEHGAIIWQQFVQAQSFKQLSVKENQYFIALAEIYRVARVLKTSSKVYKPWILLNQATATTSKLSDSLDKCDQAWNLYGLEDALKTISDSKDSKHAGLAKAALASIRTIHDLDLSHCPVSLENNICTISLLSTQVIQDMKMEIWCGKHYFVKLANLWANRVSCEAPQLPCLQIR